MPQIGVFPVHNNVFKIALDGRTGENFATIKDLETFAPSIDANSEEWTPMDTAGWVRRAITGKGLTFSFTGKRNYGDAGNDYIAGLLLQTGQSVESILRWDMPNGARLDVPCVVNLTTPAGGDSKNIDALEFEVLSDGLPTLTGELPELTFVCTAGSVSGTQIESVSPILGADNSYYYKINGSLPAVDFDITDEGWTAYTLGTDIDDVPAGNNIALVEAVTATKLVVKGGTTAVVV